MLHGPERERNTYVVYDKNLSPKDGDTVIAYVEHYRLKPKPKAWQMRKLREWEWDREEYKDDADGYTARRFGLNESGQIALSPLDPASQAWTEGEMDADGYMTRLHIMGVAIDAIVWAASSHEVMALGLDQ